ncbi:unnamed protein product [Arctia plantaginis]|uniref:BZIP domain-containing protein n=1 Tax=Arctia plantaginis TaxID=874455 RepID=A0A8S0Z637_ARCPL|nr:unnamed protein product [Arctia plantaginis]CAB3228191.1 unnamed protein product [Arctia plantaginis]
MALWRPYLEETALDFSTCSQISPSPSYFQPVVKVERISPDFQRTQLYYESYNPIPSQHYEASQPLTSHAGPTLQESSCESWSQVNSNALFPNVPSPSELYENDSLSEDEEYQEFERESFRAMAAKNGGCIVKNNPRMRRVVQTAEETNEYKEKRIKNNIAAKQSRDRRKLREARLGVRVTFLKKKLAELKAKLNNGACAQCMNSQRTLRSLCYL